MTARERPPADDAHRASGAEPTESDPADVTTDGADEAATDAAAARAPASRGITASGSVAVLTLLLAALSMLGPFTIDTVFPAFVSMGDELGADELAMQQVTSLYMLSFAVMSVFHGPISDALGRKPVMIVGLVGYVVATVACALAPSFGLLLLGRVLQGAFAGAATIVSRVVVRDLFEGPQAHKLMSRIMMIFSVAPAIAPVIGGWLLVFGDWRLIFWAIAGYGVLTLVATVSLLRETHPPSERTPLRVGSVLGSLVQVGRAPAMLRLAGAIAFLMASQFVYVVGAPIIVVRLLGLGEQDFWMLFVPVIGGLLVGAWLSGRLADRMPRSRLIDLAIGLALAAGVINVTLGLLLPRLPFAVMAPALLACAVAVAFPAVQLEILDLFPRHRGAAASLGTFATLAFNALLAGAIVPVIASSLAAVAAFGLASTLLALALWGWHRRAEARDDAVDDAPDDGRARPAT